MYPETFHTILVFRRSPNSQITEKKDILGPMKLGITHAVVNCFLCAAEIKGLSKCCEIMASNEDFELRSKFFLIICLLI